MTFTDRLDAGKQLAERLAKYTKRAVVYALPRGGVVLGAEIARELEAPLDLILVRKIGHPGHEEYAIGAVAEGGKPVFNQSEREGVEDSWLKATLQAARAENERRRGIYFPTDYQPSKVAGKVAILVDDGIATGLTMEAAVETLTARNPKKIVIAVPVAPADSIDNLKAIADEVIVIDDPLNFRGAVGAHYENFPQIEDDEVIELLADARDELAGKV